MPKTPDQFRNRLQDYIKPTRFSFSSQIIVSAIAGPFGTYVYLLGQRIATDQSRVRLGWATLFLAISWSLFVVLLNILSVDKASLLHQATRAVCGLAFVGMYSLIKNPKDQGIPMSPRDFSSILPSVISVVLALMLELGLRKVLSIISFEL